MPMQFILWDTKDGSPSAGDSGLIGRVGIDNVYLRTYGKRPEGAKSYDQLMVWEAVHGVVFSLGGKGTYSVYRVA